MSHEVNRLHAVTAILWSIAVTLTLGQMYQQLAGASSSWFLIAIFHLFMGLLLLLSLPQGMRVLSSFGCIRAYRWGLILPGGALLLAAAAHFFSPATAAPSWQVEWGWIFLSPLAEEIFFRGALYQILRLQIGEVIGAYLSAVVFAVLHTGPTWERFSSGHIGIALGPLMLGFFCQWLLWRYKSLWPAVFFHAGANLTPPILQYFGDTFVPWLDFLHHPL